MHEISIETSYSQLVKSMLCSLDKNILVNLKFSEVVLSRINFIYKFICFRLLTDAHPRHYIKSHVFILFNIRSVYLLYSAGVP